MGPIIGSYLNGSNGLGPRYGCDLVAFVNFGFAIILFVFNCGFTVFSENRNFLVEIAKYRADEVEDDNSVVNIKSVAK